MMKLKINTYKIFDENDNEIDRLVRIRVLSGPVEKFIVDFGQHEALSKSQKEFIYLPLNSSMTQEILDDVSFDTLADALQAFYNYHNK